MDWNDLQFLLAIARNGTLSSAARELGVNQTTVTRRIKALEMSLGSRLVERQGRVYQLTVAGERAVDKANIMYEIAQDLAASAGNSDHAIAGTVKLTSTLGFIHNFIIPRLPDFIEQYPNIELELVGTNQNLSLARRQADISVRMNRPVANNTAVRKIGRMDFAVYGVPRFTDRDYCNDATIPWAIYDKDISYLPEHQWFDTQVKGQPYKIVVNDSITLINLVTQGIAIGILPCYTADPINSITRLSGDSPIVSREMWISTHKDIRHVVRIRRVIEWLSQEIETSELGL